MISLNQRLQSQIQQIRIDSICQKLDSILWREDKKGQGKPCGKGFISIRKRCSPKKSQQLASDLKSGDIGAKARVKRGKELAKSRQELKRQVEADKGKKARDTTSAPRNIKKLPEGVQKLALKNTTQYKFEIEGKPIELSVVMGDVIFSVSDQMEYNQELSEGGKRKAAIKLAKIMLHEASTRPDGYQYKCSAFTPDGYGARRSAAYETMGFTKATAPGKPQFAIVKNGKLQPDTERVKKKAEALDLDLDLDLGLEDLFNELDRRFPASRA